MAERSSDTQLQAEQATARGDEAAAPVKAFDWAYLNNPTTYLGLVLALCAGAPLAHFWGWVAAAAFMISATVFMLGVVIYTVRAERGEKGAVVTASSLRVGLVVCYMLDAMALFVSGDRAAWAIAITIPSSLVLHAIFSASSRLRYMWTCLVLCAVPMIGFLLYGAWVTFHWWIAVPATISACAMWGSIAASARWAQGNSAARERAIAETRAVKQRLEFAIEAAGDGYFEVDLATREYRRNTAMQTNFGHAKAPPNVSDMSQRIHPEDIGEALGNLKKVEAGELTGWNQDLRVKVGDGSYCWMQLRARLLEMDNERTLLGTLTDISERKAMEEELRAAKERAEASNRAKSEFLANMSHEIRTPLNGVLGMAQSFEADDLTESQRKKVAIILDSGKSLTSLLNDVLDLSKIEAGKLEVAPVPGDLLHTVKRVRQLFQMAAEEKGLQLAARFSADFPQRLVYDPVRVRQCVSNLISNAVKFTARGRVEVAISSEEVSPGEHVVKIDVSDTGIGITPEVQEKLFTAFTQADGATTRSFGGTGLGLAISRRLARMMGGDITVSSAPGAGSTFTLTFKAAIAQVEQAGGDTARAPSSPSAASGMRGKRVLLTDDNAVNRQVIKLFMAPLACEVIEATNGKEALDILATETVHIVLLDVHMPMMDGTEAIRRIRSSAEPWKDIPVIALTADAMSGDREKYLAMGMTDYVSKPVDQRELSTKMLQAINGLTPGEAERRAG